MRYIDAVHAQALCLTESRRRLTEQLADVDLTRWRAGPLVLAGMGASYNAIKTALPFYRDRIACPVWACLASDLLTGGPAPRNERPALIAVSQSGQSREVVESFRNSPTSARLALTAQPGAAIGAVTDLAIDLLVSEDSAVRVIGYTASVQALVLLAEALAGTSLAASNSDGLTEQLEGCSQAADAVADNLLGDSPCPASVDFVGTGSDAGTAAQGALLAREACRLHATSYDTYQYLHGPIEAVGPGALLVALGSGREVALARSLALAGAKVLLVTEAPVEPEGNLMVLNVPALQRPLSWLPAVVAVQVLAWKIAERLGLAVESFQHHQDDTKVA